MKRLLKLTVLAWLLSAQVASADILTNLVGWWKLDEGTGTSAADSSGSGNHGTLTNGPTWATPKIGAFAVDCDGTNDLIDAGSAASLDNLSAITFAAWINPDSVSATTRDIVNKRTAAGGNGWKFGGSSSGTGRLSFLVQYDTSSLVHTTVSDVVTVSVWNHIVVAWDGSTTAANAKIYVNGSETTYTTTDNAAGTRLGDEANSLSLCARIDGTIPWGGLIDDVRIYSRALSAADITELYAYRRRRFGTIMME